MSASPKKKPSHKRRQSRLISELQGVPVSGDSIFKNPDIASVKDTASESGTVVDPEEAAEAIAAATLAQLPTYADKWIINPVQHATTNNTTTTTVNSTRPNTYHSADTAMTGNQSAEEQEAMQNKVINEEYKIWKKNSVFLYDIIYSRALDWPTLTTQWLPDVKQEPGKTSRQHRMILGTHTSGNATDYLQIAHINLPQPPAMSMADYNAASEELGGK